MPDDGGGPGGSGGSTHGAAGVSISVAIALLGYKKVYFQFLAQCFYSAWATTSRIPPLGARCRACHNYWAASKKHKNQKYVAVFDTSTSG